MWYPQKKLNDSEYGSDLSSVEKEYESHQREHKITHQFSTNVDQCATSEVLSLRVVWPIAFLFDDKDQSLIELAISS